ncbi:MAG: mannose-6-phosphate isomerase, class I [Rhodoluna sp.]
MLVKITNKALDYAWGSKNLISDYFGIPATGKPMAEIWFGTHDGSPTEVVGEGKNLYELLSEQRTEARLPYLLKILAAEAPLSIQAHPNPAQAVEGFDRENSLGIALDATNRNYKDDRAKPELIAALSETFDALVGFADTRVVIERFQEIQDIAPDSLVAQQLGIWIDELSKPDGIRRVFLEILTKDSVTKEFVAELVDLAEQCPNLVDLVSHLNSYHENDRGIIASLLMNRLTLAQGEAVFVPAGSPHAYLSGLGVEVMLASDNVLRGGLTPKHIDIEELSRVLVFESTPAELVKQTVLANGLKKFEMPTPEFTFYSVAVSPTNLLVDLNLPGDAILLCVSGSLAISTSKEERAVLEMGEAAFVSGDARTFSVAGSGFGYLVVSAE